MEREQKSLILKNQALEREISQLKNIKLENTKLKKIIRKQKDENLRLKQKAKEFIENYISQQDEADSIISQQDAENHKLKLLLNLHIGKDIPNEEFTQLLVEENKLDKQNKENIKKNTIKSNENDEDIMSNIIKAEGHGNEEENNFKREFGEFGEEKNENDSNEMLAQFLKENEIVEHNPEGGMGDDYEDQDEDMLVFSKGKRRDSF